MYTGLASMPGCISPIFQILFAFTITSVLGNPIDLWSNQFQQTDHFPTYPAIANLDVKNDIGELLSNADYFTDQHHQKYKRVKKVLPQPPFSNEINFGHSSEFVKFPTIHFREKRFLKTEFKHPGIKPFTTSQKEFSAPTGKRNILKTDFQNITGIELNYFQNGLLVALKMICPDVREKYSMLLNIIEDTVRDEIRSASFNHQLSNVVRKDNLLNPIKREIYKCATVTTTFVTHQKTIQRRQQNPTLHQNPYSRFKEHLENKLKRLAQMSQMDVIPSQKNTAMLFEIIQTQLTKRCFENLHLKDEVKRIGALLISTIRKEKVKRFGKAATLHQREMEELLHDVKECLISTFKA